MDKLIHTPGGELKLDDPYKKIGQKFKVKSSCGSYVGYIGFVTDRSQREDKIQGVLSGGKRGPSFRIELEDDHYLFHVYKQDVEPID